MRNSFHCPSTLRWPRSVKRSSCLFARRLPNTGSAVANHLRTLVIRQIAFPRLRGFTRAAPVRRMRHEPRPDVFRIRLEFGDTLPGLRDEVRLHGRRLRGAVPGEHRRCRRFQFRRPLRQRRPRPTPVLGGGARQLHAVDRKHLPANAALLIADGQDAGQHRRDVVAQRTDAMRDRRDVRRRRAAEGDERHVVLARARDGAAAHHAVRIRAEHHLEQHPRRICRGARDIILESGVERRQVELVLEQVMDGMRNRARQELLRQIHG